MSQMIVRPPSLWINPFGNLAEEYSVYVGKPFQDPTQTSSQLTVKDGRGEDANIVMQPIIVTEGVTRNRSGQKILPVIDSQNYSLLYVSTNGSRIYSESSFFGDGLSSTGEGGALAEEVFNNLQQALSSDLTGFNYIFIQSEFIGWEGTSEGPTVNSLYYYNGGSGPSSTGDVFTFYDSAGNEWKLAKSVTEQTNENEIIINRGLIDDNAAQIASVNTDLSADIASAQSTADAAQDFNQGFKSDSIYPGGGNKLVTLSEISGSTRFEVSFKGGFTAGGANTCNFRVDVVTSSGSGSVGIIYMLDFNRDGEPVTFSGQQTLNQNQSNNIINQTILLNNSNDIGGLTFFMSLDTISAAKAIESVSISFVDSGGSIGVPVMFISSNPSNS